MPAIALSTQPGTDSLASSVMDYFTNDAAGTQPSVVGVGVGVAVEVGVDVGVDVAVDVGVGVEVGGLSTVTEGEKELPTSLRARTLKEYCDL